MIPFTYFNNNLFIAFFSIANLSISAYAESDY